MPRNVFQLKGGLGNQLFIYYAAASYSIRHNIQPISFDISGLNRAQTSRTFELHNFDLPIPYCIIDSDTFSLGMSKLEKFANPMRLLNQKLGYLNLKEIGFEEVILNKSFRSISGYFQSWKYFELVKANFPSHFLRAEGLSDWAKTKIKEATSLNPIACHIRRGDYLDHSRDFGILNDDYFKKCVSKFRNLGALGPVWIFTDSPHLISSSLQKTLDADLVFDQNLNSSVDSFSVMQNCSHHIISNSTYSWWAAYTSKNSCAIVPEPWFRCMKNPIDLIPAHWIREKSEWN
jgi:hypothetical protein